MLSSIYLIAGVPASGKSWVCNQLDNQFQYIKHDANIGNSIETYIQQALKASKNNKPVLIETPFSVNAIKTPLQNHGCKVEVVYIIEHQDVIAERYLKRGGKPIPKQHLTRLKTFKERAIKSKSFHGTSQQVLEYLKRVI